MRRYKFLIGSALVALLAAACSSSSHSASTPTSNGSSSTAGPVGNAGGSGNRASAPGVTADTIKVGFITSQTGNASSTFADAAAGAKAAYDAINAQGGINGRKIEMVMADDQSSPAGNANATQFLLTQKVFMIERFSPYDFGGYRVSVAAGVPVVGGGFDGPEWGQKGNESMFSTTGGTNGRTSNNTIDANLFKTVGATNVAGLAYGASPSSTGSIKDLKAALGKVGLKAGYINLSVPFGGVDVTSYILAMKQAGVDGVACSCVQSTNLALFTGLRQAGLTKVKALSLSSADNSVFSDPTASAAAQGAYYPAQFPPLDLNNAATNAMIANLKKYDPQYKGGYPSFGATGAYLAAQLGIKGLQVAGQNPTRDSFIKNLTQVTGWDANGLLPSGVSFNHFGSPEPTRCQYFVQVQGNAFHSINNGKPICGNSF